MNRLEELQENGYILLKNVISKNEIDSARSCFCDQKIYYPCIKNYIENVMLKEIDYQLGWNSDYIKFRVSDNNNSSDASTFHRDIISQNENIKNEHNEHIPSFTCLSYLDSTIMEIIPKSHKNLFIPLDKIIDFYNKKVTLEIHPGDMLLFYSTMLHRGIFTENEKTRKLVQVFEVFPNRELLTTYKDCFVHVKGKETFSYVMQFLSKYSFSTSILNMIGYVNASTGYGILPQKYLPDKYKDNKDNTNFYFLSSEGLRGREVIEYDEYNEYKLQDLNRYVIKYETIDLDDRYKSHFNHYCYNRKFIVCILFLVFMILIGIVVCVFLYRLYRRISSNRKNGKK